MGIINFIIDSGWNIQIYINKYVILTILILLLLWLLCIRCFRERSGKEFEIDEAIIGIGNQRFKFKPNYDDKQIAYKLWVELNTRKLGVPIDFENDLIPEIYNSWYKFFTITRELIKEIPVIKIKKKRSTRLLVEVAIDVLNEGLRPHLTQWQAQFRWWYKNEYNKEENKLLTLQEVQKKFPHYDELIKDMKKVNQNLIKYSQILKDITS